MSGALHAWRHPRVAGAEGRCLGHLDLPVDPRKAKHLARRIQSFARDHALPREVVTSPLRRCRDVGRWLARWGWQHRVDAALLEVDFGRWDGVLWAELAAGEIDAWCNDFMQHRPGQGESVAELMARMRNFQPGRARVIVTHGGWLSAALWQRDGAGQMPTALHWPAAPQQGQHVRLPATDETAQAAPETGVMRASATLAH